MDWPTLEEATRNITEELHNAKMDTVLIDLSLLQELPTGLFASLVRTWKGLDEKRRRFVVVTSHEGVRQALEQAGLTSLWQTTKSLSEGYAALGVSEQPVAVTAAPKTRTSDPMAFEDFKGYCSVQLNPELMSMNWADVEAATSQVIEKLKSSKNTSVMVDLGPMDYVNSGLIASLVRIWKTMKERNGQFSLVSPNDAVTDVLKTAGLWKLWSVVERREEAVYDLGASKAAIAENRERRLLTLVSVSCAAIAVLALSLMFWRRETDAAVNSQLAALLLAAAALTTGLIAIFKDSGARRLLAALAVIVAIAVLSTLWFKDSPISIGQQRSALTAAERQALRKLNEARQNTTAADPDGDIADPDMMKPDANESNDGVPQDPASPADGNPPIDSSTPEATL
jgi:anti-anti-sigma factor